LPLASSDKLARRETRNEILKPRNLGASEPPGQEGEKGWAFPDEGRPIPHLALEDGVSGEVGEDRARCLMAAIVVLPSRWMSSSGGGAASRSG